MRPKNDSSVVHPSEFRIQALCWDGLFFFKWIPAFSRQFCTSVRCCECSISVRPVTRMSSLLTVIFLMWCSALPSGKLLEQMQLWVVTSCTVRPPCGCDDYKLLGGIVQGHLLVGMSNIQLEQLSSSQENKQILNSGVRIRIKLGHSVHRGLVVRTDPVWWHGHGQWHGHEQPITGFVRQTAVFISV